MFLGMINSLGIPCNPPEPRLMIVSERDAGCGNDFRFRCGVATACPPKDIDRTKSLWTVHAAAPFPRRNRPRNNGTKPMRIPPIPIALVTASKVGML